MAFSNVSNATGINIANYLQIQQTKGVYTNLPTQSELWKMILKQKAGNAAGRSMTYNVRTALGYGAVQALGAGDSGDYPAGVRSTLSEATAHFKFYGSTINVPRQLLMLSGEAMLRNESMGLLESELDAKSIALSRVLSGMVMRDGTGIIGVIGTPAVASSKLKVTLSATDANNDRSHIGWFELGDKLKIATTAGAAVTKINNDADTVAYYLVDSVDVENDFALLTPYNSSDAAITVTAVTHANDPEAGDVIYRFGTTAQDVSGSISDYGRASEELAGLPALVSSDGRTVHGLAHSGALQGTIKDCNSDQIDSRHFQSALSTAKRVAGRNAYSWPYAFMFDTTYDAFAESAEADKRFSVTDDAIRGSKKIGFRHGKDFVEFMPDEFVPKKRIWMPPQSKEVLQFYGKDFEVVDVGGKVHLKTSSTGAGHARAAQQYNEGAGVLICKHPAAVIKIVDFTA